MDLEIEGPVDDLELMFADEDDELLGDAGPGKPSNNPWGC